MNAEIDNFKEALESNNSLQVFSCFTSIVSHIVEYSESNLLAGDTQENTGLDLKSISNIQKRLRSTCRDTYKYIESGNMEEIARSCQVIGQNADKIGELFKKLEIELSNKNTAA